MHVLEYEVKIPVDDLDQVKERLLSKGWKLEGSSVEIDRYVDFRDCVGIPHDVAFRIRKRITDSGEVIGEVTYKGPRLEVGVKAREEINVEVKDPDGLAKVFLRLGFRVFTLRKRREVYVKEGCAAHVYLDRVDGLGTFVEVEVMNPGSTEDFRKILDDVEAELGLRGRPEEVKPYLDMYLEVGDK